MVNDYKPDICDNAMLARIALLLATLSTPTSVIMEGGGTLEVPAVKFAKYTISFSKCNICRKTTDDILVTGSYTLPIY